MAKIQDQSLEHYLYSTQITNTARVIRYFLISIFIVCLYIYSLYSYFFSSSLLFNAWFIAIESFVIFNLSIAYKYFKPHQINTLNAHIWLNFVSLATGIFIALGISILYYHLPIENPKLTEFESLALGSLLLVSSQLFALTFLVQRISYFTLFFIPTVLPFVYAQLMLITHKHPLFFLTTNFVLLVLLTCANVSMQIQKRISKILIQNERLTKEAQEQLNLTNKLSKELAVEIEKSKDIELQLKSHSQTLEEKIKERTSDLEKIHIHLKNNQTNLDLAHDIAGLSPWNWNIKERKITIIDKTSRSYSKEMDENQLKFINHIHPDDVQHFKAEIKKHLRGQSERFEATYRIRKDDGKWYWIHDIGSVIVRDCKNIPLHMVGIRRNIHKERIDQERLKLSMSVLEQAAEGIVILDEDFKYIEINPFYEKLTGFTRNQIIGKHIFDITSNYKAHQRTTHNNIINHVLHTGKYESELTEKFLSGKEKTIRLQINAVKDDQNRVIYYIAIISDISEHRLQEQRLSYLENYSSLTDLPNHFHYNFQLHKYLVTENESIKQFAIVRVNIDRFRLLNEYLTHNGGDELLKQFAQRLRLVTGEALIVAHLHGDNFAIVYEISHIRPSIEEHCERINQSLTNPFNIYGEEHTITVSMGIALYPDHGRKLNYLNSCADQALLEAKHLGGNTIKFYSNENTKILEQDLQLERELKQAIKNDELIIYFQPKIRINDGSIHGFEALVRWNHPTKGILPPGIFIPIAEQTSLISEIGKIVIMKTAQQIHKWKKMGYEDIHVSFNVAAQQLHRGNLIETIDRAIETYEISGKNIELELTESSLLEKSCAVRTFLNHMQARKIQISLDDFGTGYSSLSYLADFPIDTLKIDKNFISNIGEKKQEAIVSAIIAMGKAMGMTIVAEGIETPQQLEYLKNLKCDIAQGYLFSKALNAEDATDFLESKSNQKLIFL